MPLNKEDKQAVVAEVSAQVAKAQTMVLAEYRGIAVGDLTKLRAKAREQQVYLREIIEKVNGLFEGDLTEDDQLVYVNGVLRGKLLENETLVKQAASNSKEQFANSPDLKDALLHAIMDALEAHSAMSTQALGSERVREGLRDVLLGPGQLYEGLRARSGNPAPPA